MDKIIEWSKAAYEAITRCVIPGYRTYREETYAHTESAQRPAFNLERMLFECGIIENPGHFLERE